MHPATGYCDCVTLACSWCKVVLRDGGLRVSWTICATCEAELVDAAGALRPGEAR